jgi:hypothetical protein
MIPGIIAVVRSWTSCSRAHCIWFSRTACVTLLLSSCGGETSESDAGARRDGSGMDALLRDANTLDLATSDVMNTSDVPEDAEDGGAPVDANFGDIYVTPPGLDAARFDGCVPYPCDAGEVCISNINYWTKKNEWSNCGAIASGCEPSPSCLCIVESYSPWCQDPVCTQKSGDFQLACPLPPPP